MSEMWPRAVDTQIFIETRIARKIKKKLLRNVHARCLAAGKDRFSPVPLNLPADRR